MGRIIEIGICLLALPWMIVVLIPLCLLIRFESPGNPIFVQTRIGKKGVPFSIFKLRTLYKDQFTILIDKELDENYKGITKIGRFLRRSKLDEIPQLFNILIGNMTFVGPRPDIPEQVCNYTMEQRNRLLVKPGLTGVAQISGNTSLPWDERIKMDLWYIQHKSVYLDTKILVYTILTIIRGEFASSDPLRIDTSH